MKHKNKIGLSARGVTVSYPGNNQGNHALWDVHFDLPSGSITALVGVNGAGKSTLFKAIMGFVPLVRGEISILGASVADALKNNRIAYVPQSEEIDWSFPILVEDVVMMGRYGYMGFWRRPKKSDVDAVTKALEQVDMSAYRTRQIGALSGGQRKRVFLARALAQDSQVILLDEPFTGVDVKTEEQIIALLARLRDDGRMMLVATHNLGSVPEFCDRTIFIKGTILDQGATQKVFTRKNLKKAFGGVLRQFTLGGAALHDDNDARTLTILTDDERPFVQYGKDTKQSNTKKSNRQKSDRQKSGGRKSGEAKSGGQNNAQQDNAQDSTDA